MIALGLRRLGLSLPVTIIRIQSGSMSPRLFLTKPSWDCAGLCRGRSLPRSPRRMSDTSGGGWTSVRTSSQSAVICGGLPKEVLAGNKGLWRY